MKKYRGSLYLIYFCLIISPIDTSLNIYVISDSKILSHCTIGVRFDVATDGSAETEAVKDIAIRVELKAVEASIFMVISPANEKFVSEYVIENR